MATAFNIDSISQILECSICLERFTLPKALPCQHTFCLKCLQKIFNKNDKTLNCPACRKIIKLKSNPNELPSNLVINDLLNVQPLKAKCQSCDSIKPLKICKHCEVAFCEQCVDEHMHETRRNVQTAIDELSRRNLDDLQNAVQQQIQGIKLNVSNNIHNFRLHCDSILLERQMALLRQIDEYEQKILKHIQDDLQPLEQTKLTKIRELSNLKSTTEKQLCVLFSELSKLESDFDEKIRQNQELVNSTEVSLQYNQNCYDQIKQIANDFKLKISQNSPSADGTPINLSPTSLNLIEITLRTSLNQEYKLKICLDEKVQTLKQMLSKKIPIDSNRIILTKTNNFFDELDNQRTLRSYDCDDTTVLMICIRPK